MYTSPASNTPSDPVEIPQPTSTNSHLICPLEDMDVSTPTKVAEYFPQDLVSICTYYTTAKAKTEEGLESILSIDKEDRTFENTIFAIDALQAFLHSRIQALWVVSMTHTEKEVRDEALRQKNELKQFFIEQFQSNINLFRAFYEALYNVERTEPLSDQEKFYIEERKKFYEREGFFLPENQFPRVQELKVEISNLEAAYLKNLDEDSSHRWFDKSALKGVPSVVLDRLEQREKQYKLTCDYPVYFPVMEYCEVEDTRRAMYHLFTNRAASVNISILHQLIEKRELLAKTLGYKNFAEYDLADQMAISPQNVQDFIDTIALHAKEKAEKEMQQFLQNLPESVTLTAEGKIKPWDIVYLHQRYKNTHFSVDEKEMQNYFPFESTLQKLLGKFEELFDLEFEEVPNKGLWHPSTKMIAVHTKGEEARLLGHMILDLFPREGKFGHGYCVDVSSPYKNSAGEIQPAIATLLVNFTPPNEDTPSLLTHAEATTLFHELGHALHQLLGCAEMPTLSGYHVKTDFLELPSQILEEMLWEPEILESLGEHYQTKEKLPKGLIDKKIQSRAFNAGYMDLYWMVLSSMSLHYFREGSSETKKIREDLYRKLLPFVAVYPDSNQEGTFRHIADPLYRAKYYSYTWAEAFAKDVYNHMQTLAQKGELHPWQRYRRAILEPGGGVDPNKLLKNFLERDPSLEAYHQSLNQ